MVRLLVRLSRLDRRWFFLLMAIAMTLPLFIHLDLPSANEQSVIDLHAAVENLPERARIYLAVDYDPAAQAELQPFLIAFLHHAFAHPKRFQVVLGELWPAAPPLVEAALAEVVKSYPHKEYGRDYVDLGFKEGKQVVISGLSTNLRQVYPTDVRKTPLAELPIFEGVQSLADFQLIVTVSAGAPGTKEWVQLAGSRLTVPIGTAVTAVQAPESIPYYRAHQLVGISGGITGSAQYEKLVGRPSARTLQIVDALNFGHLLIIGAIVLGNLGFLAERLSRRASR